jgi:hypothetical protein
MELTNGKCGSNGERCKTPFPEEIWNDLYKLYGMAENTPGSWMGFEKDIITKTIGKITTASKK